MFNLSLVVINDDTVEYLPKLFNSIQTQVPLETIEVIIIDNYSSDETFKVVEEYGLQKFFRFNKKVKNRGVLYNKGIELATRENIIFAHSDIYFDPEFFNNLGKIINKLPERYFVNFGQYYADTNYFGNNQLLIESDSNFGELHYKQLFQTLPDLKGLILECSEACFMINKDTFEEFYFNPKFNQSLFEFDLITKLICTEGFVTTFIECKFYHYFIELHEKLPSLALDQKIFKRNNLFSIKQYTDKLNLNPYVVQVFWSSAEGYTESNSLRLINNKIGMLQEYEVQLPKGTRGNLRIDPVNAALYVAIKSIELFTDTNERVGICSTDNSFKGLSIISGALELTSNDTFSFVTLDDDPQLLFESIPMKPEVTYRLKITMLVDHQIPLDRVKELSINHIKITKSLINKQEEVNAIHKDLLNKEIKLEKANINLDKANVNLEIANVNLENALKDIRQLEILVEDKNQRIKLCEQELVTVLNSNSWKVTAPLRWVITKARLKRSEG